ncbi:M48 family metallopeptidase [Rhodospirillum rubrum]|uniref:Peptidase M48, Ste24p n=1 Tax=Rhodospirillum rubrum (strain ATCC 11170 / ATH 1.1.1 / DSM 467 / LMG 4362 / NCIMB 8255 / S1) TaxID=269796 RepID=Q2RXT2_RHORT|nr:M48 family metallopeptidase [Rhodospirillum rubrum]ABC21063.1 Peptidase M48, Ste24p [Rhodospirillum rubrum ATCC 11170]AEO46731.1 peptidase M48, Ste24p [Rhodospirillum rubrum F11]MBK5952607.1 peptidase M48 [Rhodospirillum rubrum]QXG80756.1 M48 family metallopeptidase [Rhodospirillum rubrum]HAP98941.1 peptidase M48 [Rhodospirillum rubrum]
MTPGAAPVVHGTLIEAGRSRGAAATLEPVAGMAPAAGLLRLCRDGVVETIAAHSLTASPPLAGVPRRLVLEDGRVFISPDNAAVTALLRAVGVRPPGGWIAALERLHPRLIGLLAVVLVVVVLSLRWGVPLAADAAASLVPASVERLIGAQAFAVLDGSVLEPTTVAAVRQDRLRARFADLTKAAGLSAGVALEFRQGGPFGANAIALPGGPVVVTDELLALAGEGDDEAVVGVLAHEIGHLVGRHGVKRLIRAAGLTMIATLAVGDMGDLVSEAAAYPVLLLDRGYSRSFEREADSYAIALLTRSGGDPASLARALARLADLCGATCTRGGWLASHPPLNERIRDINEPTR